MNKLAPEWYNGECIDNIGMNESYNDILDGILLAWIKFNPSMA